DERPRQAAEDLDLLASRAAGQERAGRERVGARLPPGETGRFGGVPVEDEGELVVLGEWLIGEEREPALAGVERGGERRGLASRLSRAMVEARELEALVRGARDRSRAAVEVLDGLEEALVSARGPEELPARGLVVGPAFIVAEERVGRLLHAVVHEAIVGPAL